MVGLARRRRHAFPDILLRYLRQLLPLRKVPRQPQAALLSTHEEGGGSHGSPGQAAEAQEGEGVRQVLQLPALHGLEHAGAQHREGTATVTDAGAVA